MVISSKSKKLPIAILIVVFIAIASTIIYMRQTVTHAADTSKFDAGNIISDTIMSNKDTMNIQQIQAFLDSKNACNNTNTYMAAWYPHLQYTIRDGRFICMAQDSFNGQSAAQIIWQVAQDYSINPQVLIVLLEKEQGLVTDTWPNNIQYRSATGYGCPDTAPCDSQYFGLANQLRQAANLFRNVLNGGWSNYPVGYTYVQYNPNAACGGSVVNIQNRATSALYRYTPYQPNQSALNAGYGTGDSCGAYGNRNFWMLFTDWFGSTQQPGASEIVAKYNALGGKASWLGDSMSSIRQAGNGGIYQSFQNGKIYWHRNTGAWTIRSGSVDNYYASNGYEGGYLGYPRSDERSIPGKGVYQTFEGGQIYWTASTGTQGIRLGAMFSKYSQLGHESGYLGFPTSSEVRAKDGVYQKFQGGNMYWRPGSAAMDMSSTFVATYTTAGEYNGYLGLPANSMSCNIKDSGCWMRFDGGKIYYSPESGTFDIHAGAIDNKYAELGWESGKLGYPISRETNTGSKCGGYNDIKQEFQGGTLYWSACKSPTVTVELK